MAMSIHNILYNILICNQEALCKEEFINIIQWRHVY